MKTSRASKHFHVLGYRIRRRVVYGLVGGFFLIVAGLFVFAYLRFPGSSAALTPPAQRDLAEPALRVAEPAQPESELAALLRRHREVSGLEDVTGLTLHGNYFEDGRRYEMALSMRTPELIRKNVRDPAIEIVVVSDGASGEIRVAPKQGEATVRALRADDLYWFTLVLTLYLEDHRRVGAALLPHRYRLEVNGRERAEMRVESVQLNPGLAPWLFALERGED